MAAKQGDFLLLNYTLKVKESGETVDTTFDTVAKSAHIHRNDSAYGPKFIILGEGWIPKGLEESLVGIDSGKSITVELTPEKGYGSRDPSKMRLVPLRRFRQQEIDPVPGKQIDFDGRPAVVRAVGAGRVQVDYNHPLAGRTLIYEVSIEKVLEDNIEKILNIISRRVPEVTSEKFAVDQDSESLTIEIPEEAFYLSGLQVAKKAITTDIQKYFPKIDSISFKETFKKPVGQAEPETKTEPELSNKGFEVEETKTEVDSATAKRVAERKPKKRTPATQATETVAHRRRKSGSENQR